MFAELRERIESQNAVVTVIGLGYVGLPLLCAISERFDVVGLDLDSFKVSKLLSGESYIEDVPDSEVELLCKIGATFSTEVESAYGADIIVICVPTPLDEHESPDLSMLDSALRTTRDILVSGEEKQRLIVLESTSYPGTLEDRALPFLEISGKAHGRDFLLATSPERVDPRNATWNILNTPKVVGAVSEEGLQLAGLFYSLVVDQVVLAESARAAEMSKLLENTFRLINIAFINEMAMSCANLGIEVAEVIRLASTKPFGFMPFFPGAGVGGHCIPVDPVYLQFALTQAGEGSKFIEMAKNLCNSLPSVVVAKVAEMCSGTLSGRRVVLCGVSYKPGVADTRESPATLVAKLLTSSGAHVSFVDPMVTDFTYEDTSITRYISGPVDAVVELHSWNQLGCSLQECLRAASFGVLHRAKWFSPALPGQAAPEARS